VFLYISRSTADVTNIVVKVSLWWALLTMVVSNVHKHAVVHLIVFDLLCNSRFKPGFILQGKVTTLIRWSGHLAVVTLLAQQFFGGVACPKLRICIQISQSYAQKYWCSIFLEHGVVSKNVGKHIIKFSFKMSLKISRVNVSRFMSLCCMVPRNCRPAQSL